MPRIYLQIFSLTDHAQPLNGRYEGVYTGLNGELQTSEIKEGRLRVSTVTKQNEGELNRSAVEQAPVVLAYRHSDTGVLQGTSEMLIPIGNLPWTDMPGFELQGTDPDGTVRLKLWAQELRLAPNQVTRLRFGKTMVYLKNYGPVEEVSWHDETLEQGPMHLHAQEINTDLTVAPPGGSGLEVKAGQNIES